MDSELHIFVPYTLDERGRCCKSRVVTAGNADLARVERYFRRLLGIGRPLAGDTHYELAGLFHLSYEWDVDEYQLISAQTIITGADDGIDAATLRQFEEFDKTIQYYASLNAKGQPFPGDAPVIHPLEPRWLRDAVGRNRHSRKPAKRNQYERKLKFERVAGINPDFSTRPLERRGWRTPLGDMEITSPLFPAKGSRSSRAESVMNYPPKGCHPFIKDRVVSDKALAKIPASIRNKAFHVYELCDFGDVPRATREANFLALKRRKGMVTAHYNFYRHGFGIITDMKDGVAYLGLRGEFS